MPAVLNTSIQMRHNPTILDGISEVVDLYDGLIIDLWGVVHNGKALYENVLSCFEKLKQSNKTIVLLSNAPRASGAVVDFLTELGLSRTLYDRLITSGDYALEYLRRFPSSTYYQIGQAEKDSSLIAGIGKNPVEDMADAGVIIVSNLQSHRPHLKDYHADFQRAIAKGVPMICANPDVIVNHGDEVHFCSGALALDYERFGGKVTYFGKPYAMVYEDIMSTYGDQKFLAIGDSLATDIKGAMNADIDSLLMLSGIHGHEIHADNPESWDMFAEYQAYPSYMMNLLKY